MKIFGGEFYFLLPDNFQGDTTMAIEEWLKYRKLTNKPKPVYDRTKEEKGKSVWDLFLKNKEKGRRLTGNLILGEYDYEKNKWKNYLDGVIK